MGLIRSSDTDQEEEEDDTEHLINVAVASQIQEKTEEINNDIYHLNKIYENQLPVIPSQPYLNQLEHLDSEINDRYQEVSRRFSEQYPERKRLIVLRQELQELLDMYLTYRPHVTFEEDQDA